MGILAALLQRERTGEGQRVEVTMLEAAFDLQLEPLVYFLNGGEVERPKEPLASSFHQAPYGIYETRNGYLAISLSPVSAIRDALGEPKELIPYEDPSIAMEKREDIYRALAPYFRTRDTRQWLEILRARGVWCAPVQWYDEVLQEPAVRYLNPLVEIDHPRAGRVNLLKHPVRYGGRSAALRRLPPEVGEHTREVLKELDYSQSQIDGLRAVGAI
jgi:crotonobetainyl-CoA:carnitine CoA-transferase CaiB-like acyl-CoA transferase